MAGCAGGAGIDVRRTAVIVIYVDGTTMLIPAEQIYIPYFAREEQKETLTKRQDRV